MPVRSKLFALALLTVSVMTVACGGASGRNAAPTSVPAGATSPPSSTTGGSAPTRPRPAALADLPVVELVAPGALNAGRAPTFRWASVAGATAYRLTVLGPDAPRWSWQGDATEVRYGGVPEGVDGPSLVAGSWWSVAAIDGNGAPIALSDLRAVSPADDPGPEPRWANATGVTTSTSTPTATPAADEPCAIVSTDEIAAAVKGEWGEPEDESFGPGSLYCTWTSTHGTLLSLSVDAAGNYNPEGWGADEEVTGLGSKAYRVNHGWDRRIGWVHGDSSATLVIDFTKVDRDGFLELAHLVDDRLP